MTSGNLWGGMAGCGEIRVDAGRCRSVGRAHEVIVRVLREEERPHVAIPRHLARQQRPLARRHTQQGRLAGAVRADEEEHLAPPHLFPATLLPPAPRAGQAQEVKEHGGAGGGGSVAARVWLPGCLWARGPTTPPPPHLERHLGEPARSAASSAGSRSAASSASSSAARSAASSAASRAAARSAASSAARSASSAAPLRRGFKGQRRASKREHRVRARRRRGASPRTLGAPRLVFEP